jgi:hypothetical protein
MQTIGSTIWGTALYRTCVDRQAECISKSICHLGLNLDTTIGRYNIHKYELYSDLHICTMYNSGYQCKQWVAPFRAWRCIECAYTVKQKVFPSPYLHWVWIWALQ